MIEIDIEFKPVIRALRDLASKLEDRRELMGTLAGIMHHAVDSNFADEGRPRWVKLHDGTIASRSKEGRWPGQILRRSGQLASSIQDHHDNDRAVVDTNKVYAAMHQFGGTIKPRTKRALKFGGVVVRQVTIPARPYLSLTPQDEQELLHALKTFAQQRIQRSGR
jgi:phage virion morphogenesis protein